MTVVETAPVVEEMTADEPEIVHLVCCWDAEPFTVPHINPLLAFCGTDVTDHAHIPTGGVKCVVCDDLVRPFFNRVTGPHCPRTGRPCPTD